MEEIALPEKDASAVQGNDSADPLGLFPEPPTSDFPHMVLVLSHLPSLEPRVSDCKQNFVHWPFKRVAVSLAGSPW